MKSPCDFKLIMLLVALAVQQGAAAESGYLAASKAAEADRKPLIVLVTADWCAPCQQLKADVTGTLSRWRAGHWAEVKVEEAPAKLLKANQPLPQIAIYRYVGGQWQRFDHFGYSGLSDLNVWLRGVWAWQAARPQTGPLSDPVNWAFFQREHYSLGIPSCGMIGCPVHSGG